MEQKSKKIEIANLIFPEEKDISYYEEMYPERKLKEGAIVTRFAPSPTGFVHIGGLYQCILNMALVKRSEGCMYLRIEDTDREREVENGIELIVDTLRKFQIQFDEGPLKIGEEEIGIYGPYKQSKRGHIYRAYAKELIKRGKAYPCFLTKEELGQIRENQSRAKIRPGIYGKFAKYREMPDDLVIEKLKENTPFVIRFKSSGDESRKIKVRDLVKGTIEMPENDQDIVIIKSDGLPTYHFAHSIDDHLMHTTHVIRSDEWFSSLPLHIELFLAQDFKIPKYVHYSPIEKKDGDTRRKISKRKDPEASAEYYLEQGIPLEGLYDYLLNIANSAYEGWRRQNPEASYLDFDIKISRLSKSGALFDLDKLLDVCKISISYFTAEKLFNDSLNWAKSYDLELKEILERDKEYSVKVLNIEREGRKTRRRDIAKFSDIKKHIIYMFDEEFFKLNNKKEEYMYQNINNNEEIINILEKYMEIFNIEDEQNIWWEKISKLAENLGYAPSVKEFRENQDKYTAHVGDISTVLRVAITGRDQTPDLYEILQVLGANSVIKRLEHAINVLK